MTTSTTTTSTTSTTPFDTAHEGTTYAFNPYKGKGEHTPATGYRLSVCEYRAKGGKPAKRPNEFVAIPEITWEALAASPEFAQLGAVFADYFMGAQDEILKSKHEAFTTNVGYSAISIKAVTSYLVDKLESKRSGGFKLSGELVSTWFEECGLQAALVELLTEQAGGNATKAQVVATAVGKSLEQLASPKTIWEAAKANKMLEFVQVALDSDPMDRVAVALAARIDKMLSKPAEDNVMAMLGGL